MCERRLSLAVGLLALLTSTSASALSVGFETQEGYVLGRLSPPSGPMQQGWSGGAQAGLTNNDPGDEQIIDSEAASGTRSWHYARGYGSPGQGTPFSPSVGPAAGPGSQFQFSIRFKAANGGGDESHQSLHMGTPTGNDRTGFNIHLSNSASGDGLSLRTVDWIGGTFSTQVFATQLDRGVWHELSVSASFAEDPSLDLYEYELDGSPVYTGNSWPNPWRASQGFDLVYGDSIKFADEGGDQLAHSGFYYDDLSYAVSSAPEPAAIVLFGLGLVPVLSALSRTRTARKHDPAG